MLGFGFALVLIAAAGSQGRFLIKLSNSGFVGPGLPSLSRAV